MAVDKVCRYERLDEGLTEVARTIGIADNVSLAKAKAGHRPRASWRDYYTPETREIVARWYAREIEAFGYTFDGD